MPFPNQRETKYAIEITDGLSLLAFHNPHARTLGLDQEPQTDWPNVRMVHISFQIMVGCGSLLSLFALVAAWLAWKKGPLSKQKLFLKALILVSPLGFVALEAGWMVTEIGRQPWIIYRLMRTRDAVTSTPNIAIVFSVMMFVYLLLGVIVVWLLSKHVIAQPDRKQLDGPGVLV
jgi:cytochrome bd ubiquinol oxidase subunit I